MDLSRLSFEESPIMSTYLVAIVIGQFEYIEAFTPDGINIRVYSQVGKSSLCKFALDVAVKTLDLYKRYFAIPYPLSKLDMVAIPDFAAGAMENYGLVTYRESAFLFDDRHSAASDKQEIAISVTHELAHHWFGNLVTMEWWTDLWLNEGFATWVSYLAADSLFPEWKIWTQFLDETTSGLRLDALAESHPIEVEINHANEIDEIFYSISYTKGASIIQMLQSFLGAEPFQNSLASYIKRFAFSNAKTEDLWTVLEDVTGEPVKALMDSWTKHKGYPVVSVKVEGQTLKLDQSQFLSSGAPGEGQWVVPVTLCCRSYDVQKKFLLKAKSDKLDISDFLDSSTTITSLMEQHKDNKGGQLWIKLNVDQTGFYRVHYDDELAAGLRYAIKANKLSATDKFGIVDDAFELTWACKQTLSTLLTLMAAYREDIDFTVLSHLIMISSKVARMVADGVPGLVNDVKKLLICLLQYSAERLGWDSKDNESHLDAMLRGSVLSALAKFGHEATLNEAARRFNAFLDDRETPLLPADTRQAAYVAIMQTVRASERRGYESLLRIYREADLSQEKMRVLSSLACCPDPDVVLDALNFLLSPEVRNQDAVYGLHGVSREGRDTTWAWLKENWDRISATWGSSFLIGSFVKSVASPFCSEEMAKEVEDFFASRTTPSMARTLKQSLEQVRNNARTVGGIRADDRLGEVVQDLLASSKLIPGLEEE